MKIAHVIWCKFPVEGYGGTERVCYWLAKAQAELGHEVSVLCLPGSKLPFAQTVAIPDCIESIDAFIPKGTEIVQLYGTPNFEINIPYLVNIGGNGRPGEKFPTNTVFVSKNHALRHGWTEYVYNGIDISEYPISYEREEKLLFLAKASWRVKNLKGAIRIANKAGLPLHIAGGKAACWHRGVVSHGMISGVEKLHLIQKSRALLFPVIWEEPFGLAVVESLACGTPVIATPRGALPEIISSECGFLGNSFQELYEAVGKVKKISPDACRSRVQERFTHIHMAEKYLNYYKKILQEGKIRDGFPETPMDADPQKKIYYPEVIQ